MTKEDLIKAYEMQKQAEEVSEINEIFNLLSEKGLAEAYSNNVNIKGVNMPLSLTVFARHYPEAHEIVMDELSRFAANVERRLKKHTDKLEKLIEKM